MKRSEKLLRLAEALLDVVDHKFTKIRRFELRKIIISTLDLRDSHTINNWIDALLVRGLISCTTSQAKKPYRNTLYVINVKECGSV